MEIFLKILGMLISLIFIIIGMSFVIFPRKSIQKVQQIKYKTTGNPRKIEVTVSIIFGVILTLIGGYYLTFVILSFIYPA